MKGGGGADGRGAVLDADAVDDGFGDHAVLAGAVQADLPGGLGGVDEVPALEDESGQQARCRPGARLSNGNRLPVVRVTLTF